MLPTHGGFEPKIVLLNNAYFVVNVPDGENLHVLITNSSFQNRSKREPGSTSTMPTDDVGRYFHFRCFGDYRAHSYFFARDAPQNNGPHAAHEWVIEYDSGDGEPQQCRFMGTLYGYRYRKKSDSKWAFLGTIKITGGIP